MAREKSQFNLLKGTFNGQDAKEILITLFNDKIQYHRLKNFSHEERFGKPDAHAVERIPELKKSSDDIVAYLKEYDENAAFEIYADIVIKPSK